MSLDVCIIVPFLLITFYYSIKDKVCKETIKAHDKSNLSPSAFTRIIRFEV